MPQALSDAACELCLRPYLMLKVSPARVLGHTLHEAITVHAQAGVMPKDGQQWLHHALNPAVLQLFKPSATWAVEASCLSCSIFTNV